MHLIKVNTVIHFYINTFDKCKYISQIYINALNIFQINRNLNNVFFIWCKFIAFNIKLT